MKLSRSQVFLILDKLMEGHDDDVHDERRRPGMASLASGARG